jgi:type I restriction enzyme, S subunit
VRWRTVSLGDLGDFRNGLNYTASHTGTGLRIIAVKDFCNRNRPDISSLDEINPAGLSVEKALLHRHDLVFVRSNGNKALVGRSMFVDEEYENLSFSAFCIRFRPDVSKVHPMFVAYFARSPLFREVLSSLSRGTNINNLSQPILRQLRVPVATRQVQTRIVDILSGYDDLIENNRRRMALLEEGARQLYREWFGRLRFPGHEHASVVDGIPDGWRRYALREICSVGRGASPRPIADFMGGDIPWFRIADATNAGSPFVMTTAEFVTEEGARRSVFVETGDLILSNSATCGIPFFVGVPGCVHDGWLTFANFKRVTAAFLYCLLQEKQQELVNSVGDGSTQKNLNTEAVGRLRVLLPDADALLDAFTSAVDPLFQQLLNLTRQNQKLRAARDLLLPRLMSGELVV